VNKVQTANKVSQQQLTSASGHPITCLRFSGDISSVSKDAIVGTYQALDKASHKHILLDFKGVEYLNSSGIALVIQVLMEASKSGQTVAITISGIWQNNQAGAVTITLRIRRGSTVLYQQVKLFASNESQAFSFQTTDTPGAGTPTYDFQMKNSASSTDTSVVNGNILIQ